MADLKEVSKFFVVLGGILGVAFGILKSLSITGWEFISFPLLPLEGFIEGIILIIVSLIVLATSGVVKIPALKFDNNWIILLILGIVMWVFSGGLASIFVIIGAILLVIK
jgi:hypothetical protein